MLNAYEFKAQVPQGKSRIVLLLANARSNETNEAETNGIKTEHCYERFSALKPDFAGNVQ